MRGLSVIKLSPSVLIGLLEWHVRDLAFSLDYWLCCFHPGGGQVCLFLHSYHDLESLMAVSLENQMIFTDHISFCCFTRMPWKCYLHTLLFLFVCGEKVNVVLLISSWPKALTKIVLLNTWWCFNFGDNNPQVWGTIFLEAAYMINQQSSYLQNVK